jgi:hypothetical protein
MRPTVGSGSPSRSLCSADAGDASTQHWIPRAADIVKREKGSEMATDVFMSVGRTTSEEQEEFVRAVEAALRAQGLNPVALGRNKWSSERPLTAIQKLMSSCSGSVIVAFERTHIAEGVDRGREGTSKVLRERGLPTVWNQIEAAMAASLGQPLLVIVEDGLISEGLLVAGYDWIVQWLRLDAAELRRPDSLGIIGDWKARVVAFEQGRTPAEVETSPDITGRTIGDIIGDLRPGQFRGLVVGTVTALTAIAGTAFGLGARFG